MTGCRDRSGRDFTRHWFGAFAGTRTGGEVRCKRCGAVRSPLSTPELRQLRERLKPKPLVLVRPRWQQGPPVPPTPLAAKVYLPEAGTLARVLLSGKV